jgi:anti-sigma regulatory factor (Ser/Thr protein kinase)
MEAQPDLLSRTERWPLDCEPGTLALAREHTRRFLQGMTGTSTGAVQDALVLVSELVSNAMRHAPGPCTLELADRSGLLVIAVSDTGTTPPQPRAADLETGGGFGWHLLQRLALRVDVLLDPPRGKTVSVTLSTQCPSPQETMTG